MTVSDGSRLGKAPLEDALSPRALSGIAARARPLHERIELARGRAEHQRVPLLDAKSRGRWRAASARGVEADFIRRVDHAGLADPDALAHALAEPEPDPATGIPAWLEFLVAAARRSGAPEPVDGAPPAGHELDQLLAPVLREAQARLTERVPRPPNVSAVATDDLADALRRDLSRLTGPCVDTEFAAFRTRAGQAVPDDLWQRFEREALASGLFGIWDTYPALARLVGVRVLDWVDRSGEMLGRFEADRMALAEFFAIKDAISDGPRLDAIESTASDPHNGHAQVAVCTVSGTRVVYKPKDLSAEVLLSELVGWSNGIGMDLGRATDVLARDGYGWVGYIGQAPVDDEGARRFYTRIGRLAALLFALGGTDSHAHNVVACGDAPVIIDAETVLQPALPAEDGRPVVEWVLDGWLLPRWLSVAGVAMDLSATGAPGTTLRRTELHWRNAGTAQMELVPVQVPEGDFPSAARSPTGDLYRPEDHAEQILSGFHDGWRRIVGHASDFTGPGGWLDRLADVRARVLVRMTRTYTRLLDTALDPALLRSGLERSIHLDHVARAAFDRDAEQWLSLTDAERRMLEDGDVPFFSVRADEAALHSRAGGVLIRFEESSLARAHRRLAALGDHNLELQSDVIRASLAIAPTGCRSTAFEAAPCADQSDTRGTDPATAAAVVAARMCEQVTKFGGASAPLGLVVASPSQWAIDVPTPGLYDGRIGLAVALAGGAAALDDPALAELARQVAQPVLEDAVARPRRLVLANGLGGQDGIGGILFGLALFQRIAQAADPGLEAAFLSLVRAVSEDDLDRAAPLDLLAGLPGLVAGLTAGAQVGWETETAIGAPARRRLMDAVAAQLAAVESGTAAARNGFSHGDAGLAALLARVAALETGASDEALALAETLIAAESARFDPELGGWHDLRPGSDRDGLGSGWCNGSPGVALSRALVAQSIPAPAALGVDLRRALAGLAKDRLPRDTLCCGRAGRVAVLETVSGSSALDVEGRAQARRLFDTTSAALASAAMAGDLSLGAPPSPLLPLGLFEGLGGVLYALAQASRPEMPAVLAWGADLG